MQKLLASASVVAIFIVASPVYGGFGGTHTETTTEEKTVTQDRNTTRTHTVHQRNDVEDVTHVRDVTRVHPVHHVTVIDRYVHHTRTVNTDEYATHRHVAPVEVEHTESTENVGAAAEPREHTVTRYHDVYQDDYSTEVHEHRGADAIDHEIHRHVTELTVQPVVHEHDITRVVLDNHYVKRTEHEPVEVTGKGRKVVTHKREDVDP